MDDEAYNRCIENLVEFIADVHAAEKDGRASPTDDKNKLNEAHKKLVKICAFLENTDTQSLLERLHNDREVLPVRTGLDGWPVHELAYDWRTYNGICSDIKSLAESAKIAADNLPNARIRNALKYAAQGLLHIRHRYGFSKPSRYNNDETVQLLANVCNRAEVVLSDEAYRQAIAVALNGFDPHYTEPWLRQIMGFEAR